MDAYKTHGAFSWAELMTADPKAAVEFYGSLFGWAVETMDMGMGPYHVIKAGDVSVGGIMGMPPDAPPMPTAWGSYVTVRNVDETLAACTGRGTGLDDAGLARKRNVLQAVLARQHGPGSAIAQALNSARAKGLDPRARWTAYLTPPELLWS